MAPGPNHGESAGRPAAGAQVDPFALRAEDVQQLYRLGAGVGDRVRDARGAIALNRRG
jgi:hypothetical protein